MGHNSVNIVHGVTVLALCTSSDHGLYLHRGLPKHLERFNIYGANIISVLIVTKGHNYVNIASGFTVLLSSHCQIMVYICTQFLENAFNSLRVMQRTRFQY